MKRVLVLAHDHLACEALRKCFQPDYRVEVVAAKESCFQKSRYRYEFIFVDLTILRGEPAEESHTDFKQKLQPFWQSFPAAEIIVLTAPSLIRDAVNAVKAGAGNYLTYPINPDEVKYVTESLSESTRIQYELDYLRDRFWQSDSLDLVRTHSPVMKEVFQKLKAVAPTKTTVLLTGETGTGKGVMARLIHRHSRRNQSQFIAVHCGAIPETLLESELFGHEKGSFTGAIRRKLGKFEIAHKGAIFLDEIGSVTPSAQIKLLQVLQDKTFSRVGGEELLETDVRVIAATNNDLKSMKDEGCFRSDLFYRLNVFPIEIPPLRERLEDLPSLVEVMLKNMNRFHGKEIHGVHPLALEAFAHYSWPGNIRELENILERAYILETTSILRPEGFPPELFKKSISLKPLKPNISLSLSEARREAVERVEKEYLRELLTRHHGRIDRTAAAAGITVRQLHKLLSKHQIRKEEFKTVISLPTTINRNS